MQQAKLHAVRFRCPKCHFAINDKHPDFWGEVIAFGTVKVFVDVSCSKCREMHTIELSKNGWRGEKAQ